MNTPDVMSVMGLVDSENRQGLVVSSRLWQITLSGLKVCADVLDTVSLFVDLTEEIARSQRMTMS